MSDHDFRKRFGKEMSFDNPTGGAPLSQAFYALSKLYFDAGDTGGTPVVVITMRGWHDKEAYEAGRPALKATAENDAKEYHLTGAEFEQALALKYMGVPAAKILSDLVWMIAQSIKDVQVEPPSEENQDGVRESFFEHATDPAV